MGVQRFWDEIAPGASALAAGRVRRLLGCAIVAILACALAPASAAAAFSLITSFGASGEGMFGPQIAGLATDAHGDVYVVDGESASRIEEFSPAGTFIRKWGTDGHGAGQMEFPVSIAIAGGGSNHGDLYVTDAGNRRVDEFTAGGEFIRAWGWGVRDGKQEFEVCTTACQKGVPLTSGVDAGGVEQPSGVAVNPNTGDVYIGEVGGILELPLEKYAAEGTFLGGVGLPARLNPPGAGEVVGGPTAMATNSAGDLYIAETDNERIQELAPSGNFIRLWGRGVHKGESGPGERFGICTVATECQLGGQGEEAGAFGWINRSGPASIAIDPSGNVWVPDSGNERVQEFTSEGAFVMGFGWGVFDHAEKFETCMSTCWAGPTGGEPPEFEDPLGAAASPSGCPIYVTDSDANDLVDEFGACGPEPEREPGSEPEPEPEKRNETPPNAPVPNNGGGSQSPPSTAGTAAFTSPSVTPPGIATTARAVEELLLGCSKRALVLNDVLIRGGRVLLEGSAAKSLDGKKVKIIFQGGKQVASATVGANGQFSTTAPLPAARVRDTNSARYMAESGSQRSLDLKLTRRLALEPPKAAGRTVTLVGQVVPPLTKPIAAVTVQQELECGKTTVARRFTPSAGGDFHISLTVPSAARAGIYRLISSVTEKPGATHGFATYSLPLPVTLG